MRVFSALHAYPLKYARAAGGKITVGTEAGSPYDTFYTKAPPAFTGDLGVEVEFHRHPARHHPPAVRARRASARAASTSTSPTRCGCRSSTRRASSATSPGIVTDADKADFSKTAIETVSYKGALVALPVMVHNCALYYRTDLFEKAGLVGPPPSWDEFRDFARQTPPGRHLGHAGRRPSRASRRRPGCTRSTSRPAATCSTPTASRPSTPMPATRRSSS